jgi:hypothetical protein
MSISDLFICIFAFQRSSSQKVQSTEKNANPLSHTPETNRENFIENFFLFAASLLALRTLFRGFELTPD